MFFCLFYILNKIFIQNKKQSKKQKTHQYIDQHRETAMSPNDYNNFYIKYQIKTIVQGRFKQMEFLFKDKL